MASSSLSNDQDRGEGGDVGEVSLLAGNALGVKGIRDAKGGDALFNNPSALLLTVRDSFLVADSANLCVREMQMDGSVATYLDETNVPDLGSPTALGFMPGFGILIGDSVQGFIHKLDDTGLVTISHDLKLGLPFLPEDERRVPHPTCILADSDETFLVVDTLNSVIFQVKKDSPEVILFAGTGYDAYEDGSVLNASFFAPHTILTYGTSTQRYLLSDSGNSCIRLIDLNVGIVRLFAGSPTVSGHADGPKTAARFFTPTSLFHLPNGDIAICDTKGNRIRLLDVNGFVTTLAGNGEPSLRNGPARFASLAEPSSVFYHAKSSTLIFADSANNCIRKLPIKFRAGYPRPPHSDPELSFARILNDPRFSDTTRVAFGQTWHLDRTLVLARFPELLNVNIDTTIQNKELFEIILNWIYTDSIPCCTDPNRLIELYIALNRLLPADFAFTKPWGDQEPSDEIGLKIDVYSYPLLRLILVNIENVINRMMTENAPLKERATFISKLNEWERIHHNSPRVKYLTYHLKWVDCLNASAMVNAAEYRKLVQELAFAGAEAFQFENWSMPDAQYGAFLAVSPFEHAWNTLSDVMSLLEYGNSIAISDVIGIQEDFRIVVSADDNTSEATTTVHVNAALLAARWPYFYRMYEFAGAEVQGKTLDLSEYVTLEMMLDLRRYLYTGLRPDWSQFNAIHVNKLVPNIFKQASLLGFIDEDRNPLPPFFEWMDAAYCFELAPEPLSKIIPSYHRAAEIGRPLEQEVAFGNLVIHFRTLLEDASLKEQFSSLSDQDYKRILFHTMGKQPYVFDKPKSE